jgi:hypothetical protein
MGVGTQITTGTFRQYVIPKMVTFVETDLKDRSKESQFKKFFREQSSDRDYEETRGKESVATIKQVPEGSQLPLIGMKLGYPKRMYQHKYGARAEYTKEVRKFQKYPLIADLTRELSASPPQLLETLCASIFEYGDDASLVPTVNNMPIVDVLAADKLAIWHANHTFRGDPAKSYSTLLGGGSFVALSQDAIQTVANSVRRRTNAAGMLLNHKIKKLIVPTNLRHKARELLRSVLKPEVAASNADNAVHEDLNEGDYAVWDWLESETDYYFQTTAENRFIIRWAWKWETDTGYDEITQVFTLTIDGSFSIGIDDPRAYFAVKM